MYINICYEMHVFLKGLEGVAVRTGVLGLPRRSALREIFFQVEGMQAFIRTLGVEG